MRYGRALIVIAAVMAAGLSAIIASCARHGAASGKKASLDEIDIKVSPIAHTTITPHKGLPGSAQFFAFCKGSRHSLTPVSAH
jgi:hypothetical protein